MKGLIIKDFLIISSTIKTTVFFIVFYVFLGFFTNNFATISTVLTILLAMLPITALAYDERAKFNTYALTMPISNVDIVFAKYIFGFILLIIGGLTSIIPSLFVQNSLSLASKMIIIAGSVGSGIIFQSFILPIMFKFGAEKGRLYMLISLFIPAALIIFLAQTPLGGILTNFIASISPFTMITAISVVIVAICMLSVAISIAIVNKHGFVR